MLEIQLERQLHFSGRISGVRSAEKPRRKRPYVISIVHTVQDIKGIDSEVDSGPVFILFKVKRPRQVHIHLREAWPTPSISIDSRRTVIRNRIVVAVDARSDVIRYAGVQNHNRPKPERKRQPITCK